MEYEYEHSTGRTGALVVGGLSGARTGPRRRRSLSASVTANAAAQVVFPAAAKVPAPMALLAKEAQQGLVMAVAAGRTLFVARGSTAPLRRRRSGGGAAAAQLSMAAATPAAAAPAQILQQQKQQTGARGLKQFLAGGVAGAVSKTLVAPMERVTTLVMTPAAGQQLSVAQAARHAWHNGLYRGHAATLTKIFPASAIQFAVFNGLKDRIVAAKQRRMTAGAASAAAAASTAAGSSAAAAVPTAELANRERLLAGAAAGAAASCVCYPLEAMRTMMSVSGGVSGNLLQVARSVVANHGAGALYRGFRASLVGDVLGNSLGFTCYEMGNRIYRDMNGGASPPPHLRGVIGTCSASFVLTMTMPLEVVRRRLQVQGLAGRPVLYRSALDCMRQVLREEGIAGFYAASLPSYLKVAPGIGCMYFMYELLMNSSNKAAAAAAAAPSPGAQPAAAAGQ